jgi:hypothetical protein
MINKWFKKKFREWCKEAWYDEQKEEKERHQGLNAGYVQTDDSHRNEDSIKFTVTPASGGLIISTSSYNNQKGIQNNNIHIIHDDTDVSENITKIITLELLKKQ